MLLLVLGSLGSKVHPMGWEPGSWDLRKCGRTPTWEPLPTASRHFGQKEEALLRASLKGRGAGRKTPVPSVSSAPPVSY